LRSGMLAALCLSVLAAGAFLQVAKLSLQDLALSPHD
jgi:hypothetical protein